MRLSLALLAATALLGATALAQTPTGPAEPDKLCAGLATAIAAAADTHPFIPLVPPGQSLGTLPGLKSNPAGFGDFFPCEIYRAGNATDGTIGGGPFNYFRCARSRTDSHTMPEGAADVEGHTVKIVERVNACLSATGWSAMPPETKKDYDDTTKTWRWSPPSGPTEVLVEFYTDGPSPGSRSKIDYWTGRLVVRTPNPNHPKPE